MLYQLSYELTLLVSRLVLTTYCNILTLANAHVLGLRIALASRRGVLHADLHDLFKRHPAVGVCRKNLGCFVPQVLSADYHKAGIRQAAGPGRSLTEP